MLSRVADSLYWMARYIERAEHTARLLAVRLESMAEQTPDDSAAAWTRVVEALNCSHRPPWMAEEGGDPEAGRFLNDQWGRNVMLGKWLEYLLEHGHGFGMSARPRLRAQAA